MCLVELFMPLLILTRRFFILQGVGREGDKKEEGDKKGELRGE